MKATHVVGDKRACRFRIIAQKGELHPPPLERLAAAAIGHQRQDRVRRLDLAGSDQPLEAHFDKIGLIRRLASRRTRSRRGCIRQEETFGQFLQQRRIGHRQPRHERDDKRARRRLPQG